MADLKQLSKTKCYGGDLYKVEHYSESCKASMKFNIYIPANPENLKLPMLLYLSGLTCTEDNVTFKGNPFSRCSELGIIFLSCDTSPRDTGIEDEDKDYDLGSGAGFYLDATEPKWATHYNMASYVIKELLPTVYSNFDVNSELVSIFGHSMGGHGALTLGLKNHQMFQSISAFAPICNPTQSAWGKKAFTSYLGSDSSKWSQYDATLILKNQFKGRSPLPIMIDQGDLDQFYKEEQLLPENFMEAVDGSGDNNDGKAVLMGLQIGYDHSYYFIQSFMNSHIDFHAKFLGLLD